MRKSQERLMQEAIRRASSSELRESLGKKPPGLPKAKSHRQEIKPMQEDRSRQADLSSHQNSRNTDPFKADETGRISTMQHLNMT